MLYLRNNLVLLMFPTYPHIEHWQLLTPANIQTRELWGWSHSIQKIVAAAEPRPLQNDNLLIVSDYGGEHRSATHLIYCYLVIRSGGHSCLSALKAIRAEVLGDKRIMAYKRLGDASRQKALVPFLSVAAGLDGHLVAIAVDKRKKWLSTAPESAPVIRQSFGFKGSWNPRSLEGMMRKTHFLSILVSIFSRDYTNVTWITDDDEFVANEARHDDALLAAARLTSMYVPHRMGILRLNTTGQDPDLFQYEDFCAFPDLTAGMLSEAVSGLSKESWDERMRKVLNSELSQKAEVILSWFFDSGMRLRKTLIAVDLEGSHYSVRKIDLLHQAYSLGEPSPSYGETSDT